MTELGKRLVRDLYVDDELRDEIRDALKNIPEGHPEGQFEITRAQNLLTTVAGLLLSHPKLKSFTAMYKELEQEYMPGFPPMSPITLSLFNMYFFFDVPVAKNSSETVASLFPHFLAPLSIPPQYAQIVASLSSSRLFFYEQSKAHGTSIEATELGSNANVSFDCYSGYRGQKGDLWLVRLAEVNGKKTALTTPYIIKDTPKELLLSYLERQGLKTNATEDDFARIFRFRNPPHYWFEYILLGYCGHEESAIFLTGIPDRSETLPHSDKCPNRVQ